MKIILYMCITANGYIAKEDDNTNWISGEEWDSYSKMIRRAGCMVVGHRTYDILTKQPEFSELSAVKVVIVSNNKVTIISENHVIANNPASAINLLKDFDEVIIAGGGKLNSSFGVEGLVDEMYLDIEPLVFGKGIQLFSPADFENKLELIETNKLSKNTLQLHYKVLK